MHLSPDCLCSAPTADTAYRADPTLDPFGLNIVARQIFPRFRSPRRRAFSPRDRRYPVQYADVEHERDVMEMNDVCFRVSGPVQGVSFRMAAMDR
jgi:hypothetical protein